MGGGGHNPKRNNNLKRDPKPGGNKTKKRKELCPFLRKGKCKYTAETCQYRHPPKGSCYNCGKKGHVKSQCRAPLPGSAQDNNVFAAEAKQANEAMEPAEDLEGDADMFAFVVQAEDSDDSVWDSVSPPSSPEVRAT